MASRRRFEYALLAAAGLLLGGGEASAAIYCCDDASGRRVCADVLPAACYDRSYREMGKQGGVKREITAPLSREEIARRKADEERRKADDARRAKQRRLDQALLETYASVQDIDNRRDREIGDVERSIETERARDDELRARRKRLQDEAEFYKGRPLPRELAVNLKSVESELASHATIFDMKQREIAAIRERYAADRARFVELNAAQATDKR